MSDLTTNSSNQTTDMNLTPDTGTTKDSLTNAFNSFNLVTGYSLALQNANVYPLAGDDSPWYSMFESGLQTAKEHAKYWTDTLGPNISSTVPQSIISYNDIFTNVTNDILSIINACMVNLDDDDNPLITKTQIIEILNYFKALDRGLSPIVNNFINTQQQLDTYISTIEADNTMLSNTKESAHKQVEIDEQLISKLTGDIDVLQANVAEMNRLATTSEIGIGVGIFITIAAVGLAVATGGTGACVIAGVAGVTVAGAGIGGAVACNEQISKDQQQITIDQQELDDAQKQVTALQGIMNSLKYLIKGNSAVQVALEAIRTTWEAFAKKLETVIAALEAAYKSQVNLACNAVPADNFIYMINEQVGIQAAQTAWTDLSSFAEKILDCYANTQIQCQKLV